MPVLGIALRDLEREAGRPTIAAVGVPERDLAPVHRLDVGEPPDRDRPGRSAVLPPKIWGGPGRLFLD